MPTIVPLFALKHIRDRQAATGRFTPLRPTLDHTSETSCHYRGFEKLRLFPEASAFASLIPNERPLRLCKLGIVPAQCFVFIPSESSTKQQQFSSILKTTQTSELEHVIFQFGVASTRPSNCIVKSQQRIVNSTEGSAKWFLENEITHVCCTPADPPELAGIRRSARVPRSACRQNQTEFTFWTLRY
jgi:hypothetical protein